MIKHFNGTEMWHINIVISLLTQVTEKQLQCKIKVKRNISLAHFCNANQIKWRAQSDIAEIRCRPDALYFLSQTKNCAEFYVSA